MGDEKWYNEGPFDIDEEDDELFDWWLDHNSIDDKDKNPDTNLKKEKPNTVLRETPQEKQSPFKKLDPSKYKPKKAPRKFLLNDMDLFEEWVESEEVYSKDNASLDEREYMYPKELPENVPIDSRLDLHGMNSDEARHSLQTFIQNCYLENFHCIIVIHGKGNHSKGGPKLRRLVKEWLSKYGKSYIRSFKPAPPNRGGDGATMVWLA
jgi:DNA-nicking Smr family endonuclease